jgi:hypothetical protein
MCQRHITNLLPKDVDDASHIIMSRRKVVGSRGILVAVYLQVSMFCMYWLIYYKSWRLPTNISKQKHARHHPSRLVRKNLNPPSVNIFVGMSSSDKTVSDAAIHFLLEAACLHNMESYILLGKRDPHATLVKKISLFSQHKYMPLGQGATHEPKCAKLIHIAVAPNQRELIRQTSNRLMNDRVLSSLQIAQRTPNSPLDFDNRIAKIKRSREYQRQMIRSMFNEQGYDLMQTVIAVMDLDMFAYPSIAQVIDTSTRYILPLDHAEGTQFHAICANGLQGGRFEQSQSNRGYYDTFATVLLSRQWLHSKQSPMSQDEILNWFMEQGKDKQFDSKPTYHPVSVRSCFGGLTLYRADVWLDSTCRYDRYNKKDAEYIGHKEHHTCEHIVLHECLNEKFGQDFSIAVQPDLLTLWHLI